MSHGHELHRTAGNLPSAAASGARVLPATLNAPELIADWRSSTLVAAAISGLFSLVFFFVQGGPDHLLRAYLLGFMMCFGFSGGGLALLMLQYVSGGKWGLLLRRPLEAMSRSLVFVFVLWLPLAFFMKRLYQWAAFPSDSATAKGLASHLITREQALTMIAKRTMLNPFAFVTQSILVFGILGFFVYLLNRWSLERDADPGRGTEASFDRWRIRFENLSGPGIFIYVVLLSDAAILWIMSLDVTWYSSIWGLQFLVGQGFAVFALGILTVIRLSKAEPLHTLLRATEQHDLGKLAFAFVMLNIYLSFAEFLIIWSGNVPDEIPWYLNRIHGGWWYVCALDFCCHWLIPFCLLLSRNLKRDKRRLAILAMFMIFARCVDMFWLIEPNFPESAGNLHLVGNWGILAYATVPLSVMSAWAAYYLTELGKRTLINVNDPHLEEMLEIEHAH